MTARGDLEAVIRKELTGVAYAILTDCEITNAVTARMNKAVTAVLDMADAYAVAEYGITADRREAIGVAPATKARDERAAPGRRIECEQP